MSQLSPPPAFSYPNQRVVRPPLPRAQRNRAFLAGAVSNTVLTAGLAIVSFAGVVFAVLGFVSVVWQLIPQSEADRYRPIDDILAALGLSPDESWVIWVALLVFMILGAAVSCAGIWIGKAILASSGVARPWGVTWSATGILLGIGVIVSTVISPLTAPLVSLVSGAIAASGVDTGGSGDMGLIVATSIVASVLSLVAYAAAGSLVWWWMAHALRRAA